MHASFMRSKAARSGPSLLIGLQWLVLLLHFYTGRCETNARAVNKFMFIGSGMCRCEVQPWKDKILFSQPNCDVCPRFQEMTSCYAGLCPEILDYHVESKEKLQECKKTTEQGETEKKGDRMSRDTPPKLDEFKHKTASPKVKSVSGQSVSIMHRLEPGGTEYNYASAAKGAKVLVYNKEAKGASNILGKDVDKYLRNPCSAEGKFVIIELSEETLVCAVEIANFEHYSSNLKEFEVLGSLVYPTESWVDLGHFTAKNVKQSQRFRLEVPQWVRYLKLDFLNHYGSEFYCTLSILKVYGVDAIEHMLEDLISVQDHSSHPEEPMEPKSSTLLQPVPSQADVLHQDQASEDYSGPASEDSKLKHEAPHGNLGDQFRDVQPQPVGRVAGESVLKILMQKVRSLDSNLLILEQYLEELNSRYGNLFKELDEEIVQKTVLLENMRWDVLNLLGSKETTVKDISDLVSWKSTVSSQISILSRDNEILRSKMEKIIKLQVDLENKSIVVLLLSFMFGSLSAVKLLADFTVNTFTRKTEFREFCKSKISWFFLLLNSAIVALILLF
ncbi:hypothetical protein SAY87_013711 [Trapa incisa]|uniref:SUN domain-containing protein n=1 Tax=Trapa incisa TaxID=236973 RepID=A0AAN7KGQ8_9MYRT|nr:hypothetical protein SAY87_013711 [Trapa incisa]